MPWNCRRLRMTKNKAKILAIYEKKKMLDSRGPQSVESPKQKFCVIYKACAEHFTGLGSQVKGQWDNIDSGATFCLFTASAVFSAWLNLGLKPLIPRTGADERRALVLSTIP